MATLKRSLIPRLVLEVSKNKNVCVASNVPEFYTETGELDVDALRYHVKTKATSEFFRGYTILSLVDTEDQMYSINISPYIFSKRLILYKPDNLLLLEMCALVSMIENMSIPSLKKCTSIKQRLKQLKAKCYDEDAQFLINGASMLLSTTVRYNSFVPEINMMWKDSLYIFTMHKELLKTDPTVQDLLINLYTSSTRLDEFVNYSEQLKEANGEEFKLFYLNTIFTKHFESRGVISLLRHLCMNSKSIENIFNK